jgi:YdjC-like protein
MAGPLRPRSDQAAARSTRVWFVLGTFVAARGRIAIAAAAEGASMSAGLPGLVLAVTLAAPAAPAAPTLAERLAYARDARLLIVHADDIGEWHAVNEAATRAFATGVVNSGSMMAPCPWFPEIAAWAREHPEADLGLHLATDRGARLPKRRVEVAEARRREPHAGRRGRSPVERRLAGSARSGLRALRAWGDPPRGRGC